MNILFVGDGDTKYGASHSLCQMAIALNRYPDLKISVILNQNSPLADQMRGEGVSVEIVDYLPFYQGIPNNKLKMPAKYVIRGAQYWYGRKMAIRNTKKFMTENHFDLIHSNSSREDMGAILANYYHIPLIWHIREFGDLDYPCYSYRRDYIQLMNRSAAKLIAVSDAVREHWIAKGIDPEKIVRIYNGVVPTDESRIRNRERGMRQLLRFVFAGSVSETKGQMQAIGMMRELHKKNIDAQLDIIGSGSRQYIQKLQNAISEYGLENHVKFLGYRCDVDDLLPDYDIGLVCSRSEGFGRVTAEYMMAGLPVLASDTGANAELIRDGIDGYLYKYNDIEDMTEKAMKIISSSIIGGGE